MTPIAGQLYQHCYGGLYVVDTVATHTDTSQRLVIYSHIYPFEFSTSARPIEEWTEDRFRAITFREYTALAEKPREEFQLEIGIARGKSR